LRCPISSTCNSNDDDDDNYGDNDGSSGDMLSFRVESFVFQFANQKFKD